MKSYIDKALENPLPLAGAVVLVLGVVYYLARKTVKEVAETAGGVISGNNAVTQNQTNASGEKVSAYEGAGVAGTVGAVFNSASGGVLASIGQTIGGWFESKDTTPKTYYRVLFPDGKYHAVGDTWVDSRSTFNFPQGSTVRYKLGTLNGVMVATAVK